MSAERKTYPRQVQKVQAVAVHPESLFTNKADWMFMCGQFRPDLTEAERERLWERQQARQRA